jgi:SAM-dependent methyltransferase
MNLPAPLGVIVGVDVNEPYLLAYTGGYLDQDPELPFQRASFHRRFGYQADSQSLPFKGRRFNEIRATGIMHHMDADTVRHTLLEMRRCMKSNGRIVLFEPVWPKRGWARPLAWLILRFDRGSHMRTEKKFRALLTKTLKGNWQFQRMTYAYTGLECLWAVFFDKSFPRHPIIFS